MSHDGLADPAGTSVADESPNRSAERSATFAESATRVLTFGRAMSGSASRVPPGGGDGGPGFGACSGATTAAAAAAAGAD
jgi:hypothetical protein